MFFLCEKMKIISQNSIDLISVKKEVLKSKKTSENQESEIAVKTAIEDKKNFSGELLDIVEANIEAASANPELVNNIKFFNFHSFKDYQKTQKELGQKIDVFDTSSDK